jgi:hypothetical protein
LLYRTPKEGFQSSENTIDDGLRDPMAYNVHEAWALSRSEDLINH